MFEFFQGQYKRLLRGHVLRLIRRGRSQDDALADASFLVAIATSMNIYSLAILAGFPFSGDHVTVLVEILVLTGVSYWAHRRLVRLWKSDLVSGTRAGPNHGHFLSDNVLSWLYTVLSLFAAFAILWLASPNG